jgi:hypothetical protein
MLLLPLTAAAVVFASGCEKPDIAPEAEWVRIDLYEANSSLKGFIDTKTYEVMGTSKVRFRHKLSSDTETRVTHLYLDCREYKYKILAAATYDGKGKILSREGEKPVWTRFDPDSNTETLCVTLDPAGGGIIPKRDLPIIRELLLKGMRKSAAKK